MSPDTVDGSRRSHHGETTTRSAAAPERRWSALPLDLVLVLLFAAFGRGAHSEGLGSAQVWGTAWPFLVGLLVGWAVLLLGRRATTATSSGVLLWLTTLVVGMVIRGVTESRVPHWSFVLVAGVTLAVFLVGWRTLAGLLRRRRRTAPDGRPVPST